MEYFLGPDLNPSAPGGSALMSILFFSISARVISFSIAAIVIDGIDDFDSKYVVIGR